MLKVRLYAIFAVLGLAAAAGVFSFVAWSRYAPEPPNLAGAVPQAPGVARAAAESYLDGTLADFPVSEGIAPDFRTDDLDTNVAFSYNSLIEYSWRRGAVDGRLLETHAFLVTTDTRPLLLTVPIALDAATPTLAAYPTLVPAFTAKGDPAAPLDYQGNPLIVDSVPQPIRDVIGEWGNAYATDSLEDLRRIVGDASAAPGDYRGLGGFSLQTEPVIRTALGTTNGFVVRVRLVLAEDGADGAVMSTDYDLLIQGTTTTLPRVVAWGSAGSGPTLTQYQNRL